MQSKTELFWAFNIAVAGVTAMNTNFSYHELVGWCLVLGVFAFALDYFTKTTALKEYLKFIFYMQNEGRKLKQQVMPHHHKVHYLIFGLLQKLPFVGHSFNFRPVSQEKINLVKNKYVKWREVMAQATNFIFEKPSEGLPVSSLFGNGNSRGDWGRELIHNLQAIQIILIENQLLPTFFSKKFEESP